MWIENYYYPLLSFIFIQLWRFRNVHYLDCLFKCKTRMLIKICWNEAINCARKPHYFLWVEMYHRCDQISGWMTPVRRQWGDVSPGPIVLYHHVMLPCMPALPFQITNIYLDICLTGYISYCSILIWMDKLLVHLHSKNDQRSNEDWF